MNKRSCCLRSFFFIPHPSSLIPFFYPSKSAPRVAIVPSDRDIFRTNLLPPCGELCARNVIGDGRDQMIEDNCVLLAPTEGRDGRQVIVVEQARRNGAPAEGAAIDWRVNKFRRRIDERRRQLRELQERALIEPRSEPFAQGRDEAHDPAVVLCAINPRRQVAARFHFRGEREKACARVGQVMQHADREGVIERALERQLINVCLDDVRAFMFARRRISRLDRVACINPDDITRAPFERQLRVSSLAATTFEHNLVTKKLWRDGLEPTEELLRVTLVLLRKMLPLPTKVLDGRSLLRRQCLFINKARHASPDRKLTRTRATRQLAR